MNPNGTPANLKPFQPGNPGGPGRPPKRPLSAAYEDWLRQPVSPSVVAELRRKGTRVPLHATNADMVALATGRKAIRGDVLAAKELREGVEGKACMRIEVNPDGPMPEFVVVYPAPVPGADKNMQLLEKLVALGKVPELLEAMNDVEPADPQLPAPAEESGDETK